LAPWRTGCGRYRKWLEVPFSKDPAGRSEQRAYHRWWYALHREPERRYRKTKLGKLKVLVIGHYSPSLSCARCGVSDMRALCIDHIDGGGRAHTREVLGTRSGNGFYYWLKANHFPPGFQVLCANCNLIKMIENKECWAG